MASILIIDDSENVRINIKRVLEKLGYNVEEAEDGITGINLIHTHKYDLLIVDLIIPKKNGIDILLELKNKKELKKIVITGNVSFEKEAFNSLAHTYGASSVLYKPFRNKELIDAVQEALA